MTTHPFSPHRNRPHGRRPRRGREMTAPAVLVDDLHVAYGTTWALDGVDLSAAGSE
ncbi:hypothetical protein Rhow_003233 [Rhodococcus wratislaviensis]|uniref:Uncharacterized protein n=1 Tax=Rhodococcus wratislaviensis TaxID=44752 RepID=A0A402BZ56_RHOWR|nr:hypothetical protein Rhow_003233 [Rhodococcus wratislaviensis]